MEGNAAGMVLRRALKTRFCLIADGVRLFCLPPHYGKLAERLRQRFAKPSLSNGWIGSTPIFSASNNAGMV